MKIKLCAVAAPFIRTDVLYVSASYFKSNPRAVAELVYAHDPAYAPSDEQIHTLITNGIGLFNYNLDQLKRNPIKKPKEKKCNMTSLL